MEVNALLGHNNKGFPLKRKYWSGKPTEGNSTITPHLHIHSMTTMFTLSKLLYAGKETGWRQFKPDDMEPVVITFPTSFMVFKEQVHSLGYIKQPQHDLVKWGSPTGKAAVRLPLPSDHVPPLPPSDKSGGGPSLAALLEWSKETDFQSRNSNLERLIKVRNTCHYDYYDSETDERHLLQKRLRRSGEAEGRLYNEEDEEIYCPPELPGGWNSADVMAQATELTRLEKERNNDRVVEAFTDDDTDEDITDNPRNDEWLQKQSSEIFRFQRDRRTTNKKMDEKMQSLLSTLQITSIPQFPNVLTHLAHITESDVFCLRLGSGDTPDYIHWLNDSLISTMMSLFTKTSEEIDNNVVVYDPQFLEKSKSDRVPWKDNNIHEQILKKVFITVRISVGVNVMLIHLKPFLLLTEYNPTCTLGLRRIPISRRE